MTRLLNDPLIFDTSAVYCFGHRGGLEHIVSMLSASYTLLIPPAAAQEVLSEQGYDYPGFLGSHFSQREFTASRIEKTWLSDAAVTLGAGEIAVLLLTHEVGGTAVIDVLPLWDSQPIAATSRNWAAGEVLQVDSVHVLAMPIRLTAPHPRTARV
jgi:hypothetical protein